MKQLRRVLKIAIRTIMGVLLFITSYFLLAGISCCIPVNTDYVPPADTNAVTIAVISNGVHTDIAVPVKNDIADWTKMFPYKQVEDADSSFRYISFGWGDKGFYINTPTWADLKASTAFKAMFWMSTSAMHVTWRRSFPVGRCCTIRITKEKYAALCRYIRKTFACGTGGQTEHIAAPGYGTHDAFYEAKGTYNLFKTCNVWTGNGLKEAGVRVAIWTPFEKSVFGQLPDTP